MTRTILAADDESDVLEMLRYNLVKEGYHVMTARDGKRALELAHQLPDLILLDVMMPEMDGWEVCRQLKRDELTSAIPIVFLTAKGTEFDEVLGLELGADDYIVKPVAIRSLLTRIKKALRRPHAAADAATSPMHVIQVKDLEINVQNYTARVGVADIHFTKKEFETLVHLARNRGRVITREALLNGVWGGDVRVIDRTVDAHISKIRDKLGVRGDYIETVKGVGYRIKTFT